MGVLEVSDHGAVRVLRFNRPSKLNGWNGELMDALSENIYKADKDPAVQALVLTGTGKYYCAGADFVGALKPMRPSELKKMVEVNNKGLFQPYIDFSKPLVCAVNGPAVGAAVTSARLSDYIVSSDKATFITPFKKLGLVPEGGSSHTFPQIFGPDVAKQVLEGRMLNAKEALELGFIEEVVPVEQVLERAIEVANELVSKGGGRRFDEEERELLTKANAQESINLANAMLGPAFLDHLVNFSYEKGQYTPFMVFALARATRPLWSRL